MSSKIFTLISAATLGVILPFAGCADTPAPHLGDSSTRAELNNGVAVTQTDSRYLLPNGKIGGNNTAMIEVTAKVQKIDYATRSITLKTEKGEPMLFVAGERVRNFAQIKAGDTVNLSYLLAVAFEVRNPTAQELAANDTAVTIEARAKMGEMPAGAVGGAATTIAKVVAIDKSAGTITVKKISSETPITVTARYPENLSYAKVGDSIIITSMEATVASVDRLN